jgi:hypothetical protein
MVRGIMVSMLNVLGDCRQKNLCESVYVYKVRLSIHLTEHQDINSSEYLNISILRSMKNVVVGVSIVVCRCW